MFFSLSLRFLSCDVWKSKEHEKKVDEETTVNGEDSFFFSRLLNCY